MLHIQDQVLNEDNGREDECYNFFLPNVSLSTHNNG